MLERDEGDSVTIQKPTVVKVLEAAMYVQLIIFTIFLSGLLFIGMSLVMLVGIIIFYWYITLSFTKGETIGLFTWYAISAIQTVLEVLQFFVAIRFSTQSYIPYSIRSWHPVPPIIMPTPLPSTIVILVCTYLYGFYPESIVANDVFVRLLGALLDVLFIYLLFNPGVNKYYKALRETEKKKEEKWPRTEEKKEPERTVIPFVHS